jgi:FKBP-type peptidyl-prolyl cis-trans isomerase FklB
MLLLSVLVLLILVASSAAGSDRMDKYQKRTGAKYLEEVSKKEGVYKLKSGMLVEILQESTKDDALSPNQSDSCDVTYSGTLKDGTKFDSGTTSFAPNQVIKGWTEAMQLMVEGDKWKLHIPYDLAYGERGSPPKIPPFAPLVFEIEIHKVKTGGKPKEKAREAFQNALSTAGEL